MPQEFIATGRRKDAVARIRLTPGTGKIKINDQEMKTLTQGRGTDEGF